MPGEDFRTQYGVRQARPRRAFAQFLRRARYGVAPVRMIGAPRSFRLSLDA
jgi:hypothetical protein